MFARPSCALAALALMACLLPAAARAGGYGGFDWGQSQVSIAKALAKTGKALRPRGDVEAVQLEARVQAAEHEEKIRRAVEKKRPAADIRRLKKAKRPAPRLSAQFYWVELGPLDAKVLLHFLDLRLVAAEVDVPFAASQRPAVAELLDLLESKYGAPKEHRGAAAPEAPVVDLFDAGDTTVEAWQQPAARGRSGLLHLVYHARERREARDGYLEELRTRLEAVELARKPKGPTPEERESARKAALLQHL